MAGKMLGILAGGGGMTLTGGDRMTISTYSYSKFLKKSGSAFGLIGPELLIRRFKSDNLSVSSSLI